MTKRKILLFPLAAIVAAMSQSTDPLGLNYIPAIESKPMNLTPVPYKDVYRKKADKPKSARKRKAMKRGKA